MYTVPLYVPRYGIYKRVPKSLRFPSLRVSLTLRPPERYRSFLAFPSSRSAYVSPISPEEPAMEYRRTSLYILEETSGIGATDYGEG